MTQQILFQRDVTINAPLDHVWQLVATEEGLRQWWGNPIFLESRQGGRCEEWRADRQGTTHWQGVVTHYAPPHQLNLTMRPDRARQDSPEITTISITLEDLGDQTTLHVAQRAFSHAAAIGREAEVVPQPNTAPGVPLAQLNSPAPGALPMPTHALQPGQIDPANLLLSRAQAEALRVAWAARLTALAACASIDI